MRILGGDLGTISARVEAGGEAGPLGGDSGEIGPRGPGLTGDAGDIPRPCRSGGDGVSSPDEGGEGFETVWALLRRNVGGVFLGPGGVTDLFLIGVYGGGDGDIDS